MDDNNRSRRPEDLPIPAGYAYFQQPLQGQHSQQEQQQRQQQQHYSQQQQQQTRTWPTRANLGNVRNYRPEPGIGRPNPTPPSMASRHLSGSGVYNDSPYYQESTANAYASTAIPQANLGYHHPPSTGYGQQPDPRQAQTYATSSYHPNSAMMYNVTPATSTPNASMYDASQSFPPRPAAGMQVSPTEAASHFSYQNGSPSVSASASALRSDMTTANASQHVYQQQSSLQGYPSAMNPLGAMAAQSTATPDASMDDQASATDEDPQRSFEHYQTTLREAFRDMRDGALVAASDHLLVATNELLDGFVRWGLTTDDSNPLTRHENRHDMWQDYNHAWLALLQRQKDMMESGQQLGRSQTLLGQESLEHLGRKLIEVGDKLEKHGLVDYERGVWEERIVFTLGECMDLFETSGADESGLAGGSASQ